MNVLGRRVLVCGSRDWGSQRNEFVRAELNKFVAGLAGHPNWVGEHIVGDVAGDWKNLVQKYVSCLVHGGQTGVDTLAAAWAKSYGVQVVRFAQTGTVAAKRPARAETLS